MIKIIEDIIGASKNNTPENNVAVKRVVMRFASRVTKNNEGEYWTTPFYLTSTGVLHCLKDWLISNKGNVGVRVGKGIKNLPLYDNNGHLSIKHGRTTYQLDRLMASTFLPFEDKDLENGLKNLVVVKDPLVDNPYKLKWVTKSASLKSVGKKVKLFKGTIALHSPWEGFSFTVAGRQQCEDMGFTYPGVTAASKKGGCAYGCTWEEIDEATYHKYGHTPPEDFQDMVYARDPILDPRSLCYLATVVDPVTGVHHSCVFVGQRELDAAGLASANIRNCAKANGYCGGYKWTIITKHSALNKDRTLTPEMKIAGERVQARRCAMLRKPVPKDIKYGKDFILTGMDIPEYLGKRFFVKGGRVEALGFRYKELVKAASDRFLVMGFSVRIAKEGDSDKYPRLSPTIAAVVENHIDSTKTIIRNSAGNHRAIIVSVG